MFHCFTWNRAPALSCLKLVLLLHILGSEKIVSSSVGTYIHHSYSDTAIKLKWQQGSEMYKWNVFLLIQLCIFPSLTRAAAVAWSEWKVHWTRMPPRRNQLPLFTAIIPSLQMFLYSQGSVIQLIFKKGKAIEIKLAVVKRILFMVKCSITEQILAGPPLSHFSCYAPTSQLKPLLTPQQHVYYQQCNHHNRKSMTTKLVR